ncbi:class I glutamine amidotransferase-like protein [Tribonema minus]|uniref:CTP synthase (glutamine hydrolyzing) n=1 Tax=Tribonema minus TaxID=303371 RepID=A0A836CAL1_9STRA|nr:class I glutamine amidotransferase-like protein [Tribonema minus]
MWWCSQAAVIEYARTVLGVEGANSAEFAPALDDAQRVVVFMPEGSRDRMGGTMRLGARETRIDAGSLAHELYGGASKVDERHRHRYEAARGRLELGEEEVNPDAVPALEGAGLRFVGRNSDGTGERMEVIELPRETHPFFIAAQYHPEFKSRPSKPAPLFIGLMRAAGARAAARRKRERQQETVEEAVEDGMPATDAPEAAPSA